MYLEKQVKNADFDREYNRPNSYADQEAPTDPEGRDLKGRRNMSKRGSEFLNRGNNKGKGHGGDDDHEYGQDYDDDDQRSALLHPQA